MGLLLLFSMLLVYPVFAQTNQDSTSQSGIRHLFEQARWDFHSRTFLMATVNKESLKDDYTLAQGAGIGMLTKSLKGFQFGVSGYFIFNVISSDLIKRDSTTGLLNRYEIGQYDVTDLKNKTDMDRLEELYLRYSNKHVSITIGRMNLNTPFMNPQDGRMRPTLEEGLWISTDAKKKFSATGGYIWRVSPRSTLDWYSTSGSVGIYNQGLTTSGKKSNYKNNIQSKGFAMAQLSYKPAKNWSFTLWDGYFENVMNSVIIEAIHLTKINKDIILRHGLMAYRQDAVSDGGSADSTKRYIDKGAAAMVISAQQYMEYKHWNWSVNYTRITRNGRYLNPREWGRDYFYTFMSRERNEGLADVHAFTSQLGITSMDKSWITQIGYGYYRLPSVYQVRLNKYGMPSYHQFNIASTYRVGGWFKGTELRLLVVHKLNADKSLENAYQYLYNKADMWNFNFIIDFKI